MKKLWLLAACILWAQPSHAQMRLGGDATVAFSTIDEGKRILTAQDAFVRRMSPFDRAARMKTDRNVSEKEYLEFVGKNVLAWSDAEKNKLAPALEDLRKRMEPWSLPFPKNVFLVKTTGKEEGQAAYTRANAIVIPRTMLDAPVATIRRTICHELFHVMSRADPKLRNRLYAIIGFVKCDEVEFPKSLKSRAITNPDAPCNDHCIRLKAKGKSTWAIPILLSATEKYDVTRGGEFFHYLRFQFLLVHREDSSPAVRVINDGGKPNLVRMQQVSGFFEQVGRNTRYVIHPDEILADNFTLLVQGNGSVRSPEILERMRETLSRRPE